MNQSSLFPSTKPQIVVDRVRTWDMTNKDAQTRRNGSEWSHLTAREPWDPAAIERLHEVAKAIGLKRAWFQDKASLPHYDVTPPKRALALKQENVVEIEDKPFVEIVRELRARRSKP